MAAPGAWRKVLNDQLIFKILRQSLDKRKATVDSSSLIAIKDGELYVWDNVKAHLLTTNLKNLVQQNERSGCYQVRFFIYFTFLP